MLQLKSVDSNPNSYVIFVFNYTFITLVFVIQDRIDSLFEVEVSLLIDDVSVTPDS